MIGCTTYGLQRIAGPLIPFRTRFPAERSSQLLSGKQGASVGRTSSRRYSPTSLQHVSAEVQAKANGRAHAWLKTMIDVGSSLRVSRVLLAVTPKPCTTLVSPGVCSHSIMQTD